MTFLNSPSTVVQNGLTWTVSILAPLVLILTAVRLLLTPAYVEIEYRTPKFPADSYGFTLQDRLKWSKLSLEYLLNDEGIEFLEALKFENGDSIYNARELRHMVDVKNVVKAVLNVWMAAFVIILIIGIWANRTGWWSGFLYALRRGSIGTIGFVGFVVAFVLVAFGVFFVFFHQIFFDAGTWTFLYSDTLIRLFPERFWRDTFIWVGGIAVLEAVLLYYLTRAQK